MICSQCFFFICFLHYSDENPSAVFSYGYIPYELLNHNHSLTWDSLALARHDLSRTLSLKASSLFIFIIKDPMVKYSKGS